MPVEFHCTWPLCAAVLLHCACSTQEHGDSQVAATEEIGSDIGSQSDEPTSSPAGSDTDVDSETEETATDETATDETATDETATDETATDGALAPDAGGEPDDSSSACDVTTTLRIGMTYGGYTVYALRAEDELAPGEYTFIADSDELGVGHLFKDGTQIREFEYDVSASLTDGEQQTLSIPGFFEIDLGSATETDLSALDGSILDGCHVLEVTAPIAIMTGETYGPYLVEELTFSEDLPSGTYTFTTDSGNDGNVTLLRDGETYDTLEYEWQTTVGGGTNYTFDFDGMLVLTVTREMGTSNLFAMADWIFNGRHQVLVP